MRSCLPAAQERPERTERRGRCQGQPQEQEDVLIEVPVLRPSGEIRPEPEAVEPLHRPAAQPHQPVDHRVDQGEEHAGRPQAGRPLPPAADGGVPADEHPGPGQGQAEENRRQGRNGEPICAVIGTTDPEQGAQQQGLRPQVEHSLVLPQGAGQLPQGAGQEGRPQPQQHPRRGQQEPVSPAEQAGGQQQQLQREGEAPQRDDAPVLLHQDGQEGEAGPHQFPGEYQPEPVQGMPHRQIADEADQGGAAVEDVLNPAQAAQQGQVFFRQGLGGAGLYVLAGGEQLVLRHL